MKILYSFVTIWTFTVCLANKPSISSDYFGGCNLDLCTPNKFYHLLDERFKNSMTKLTDCETRSSICQALNDKLLVKEKAQDDRISQLEIKNNQQNTDLMVLQSDFKREKEENDISQAINDKLLVKEKAQDDRISQLEIKINQQKTDFVILQSDFKREQEENDNLNKEITKLKSENSRKDSLIYNLSTSVTKYSAQLSSSKLLQTTLNEITSSMEDKHQEILVEFVRLPKRNFMDEIDAVSEYYKDSIETVVRGNNMAYFILHGKYNVQNARKECRKMNLN